MGVGEAFSLAGQVYVLGFAIALGMAALIKLINYVIRRSEEKAAAAKDEEGGAA
ncbi:MAG: hypothetical protein LBR44_10645 [Clostridiales Family XIII bacterium]|jgi:hypothetical protein|nr:hypothetical protein [Clostridiales Family XIII bacterium]